MIIPLPVVMMKEFALRNLLLCATVVISLGACSSDPAPVDSKSDSAPSVPNEQLDDQLGQTPVDNPGDTPAKEPVTGSNPDSEPITGPDVAGATDDPVILIPTVAEGSDLDRLIGGINQQASRTILNLSRLLREGTGLSKQQNDCLGTYDPALGETLLSISCDPALPTGNVALYVGEAAFYDTVSCNASVFAGNTTDCQLQRASITIPDKWTIAGPTQLPQPVFAGTEIYYAINNTTLRIESTEDMLTGAFRCDIELGSGQTNAAVSSQSCDDIIKTVADRIETLLADQ